MATEKKHPFEKLRLKPGKEVWVRCKVKALSERNTMGWAHGMLTVVPVTHGLNQDPSDPQVVCTDVRNIRVK